MVNETDSNVIRRFDSVNWFPSVKAYIRWFRALKRKNLKAIQNILDGLAFRSAFDI